MTIEQVRKKSLDTGATYRVSVSRGTTFTGTLVGRESVTVNNEAIERLIFALDHAMEIHIPIREVANFCPVTVPLRD